MQRKKYKITRSFVSILMSILIIAASVIVSFAATELTTTNIAELPTAVGEMFYGQTLADVGMALEGGKVTVDGTADGEVIYGTFEFVDTSARPVVNGTAQVKFIPADTEAYTTIETEVAVTVNKTTPIYSELPTAGKASAVGKRLSQVTLTEPLLVNPYTNEEIAESGWAWASRNTKVNAPGLFEVKSSYKNDISNYNRITTNVWVSIEGYDDSLFPTIKEYPKFTETVRLDPSKTWGDYTLTGGKAVVKDTDGNEIEAKGTFTIDDAFLTAPINRVGNNNITIQFESADETVAASVPVIMSVTVEKPVPAWKDGIIPTYEVAFGTKINGSIPALEQYLAGNGPEELYLYAIDENGKEINQTFDSGEHHLKAKVNTDSLNNENWDLTNNVLDFILKVVPGKTEISNVLYNYKIGSLTGSMSKYCNGTVDITVGDEVITGVQVKSGRFETNWFPKDRTKNSTWNIKISYNAAEGDNAVVESDYEGEILFKAKRAITVQHRQIILKVNNTSYNPEHTYSGDTIYLDTMSGFLYWEITDVNGNSVLDQLEVIKNTTDNSYFEFKMPEYDIIINAVHEFDLNPPEEEKPDDDNNGGGILDGIADIDGIDGFFEWLMNLINKIKAFFEKIIEFFQNIGDMT